VNAREIYNKNKKFILYFVEIREKHAICGSLNS